MSFKEVLDKFEGFNFEGYFEKVTDKDVKESIYKEKRDKYDLLNLLSPKAQSHIEEMAVVANKLTEQWFGRTIMLYIPLYVSNYCTNECTYCGFNKKNHIGRKHLRVEEIEEEAIEIAKTGIKHILLLTGEAEGLVTFDYLVEAVKVLKKHFASITIEVYPLSEEEYSILHSLGVDGLTIYQEVYDQDIYKDVHLSGKKSEYLWRLDTPERGAKAGLRSINTGALFGLGNIKKEAFFSAMHTNYLTNKYLNSEFSLSLPRINNAEGGFKTEFPLDDITFVQIMLAYRLFLPRAGINISTREKAEFRESLLPLGVTKFSAGSKTSVGAYKEEDKSTAQFETSDKRSTKEIVDMLKSKKYQVIYKDWELIV